MNTTAWRYYVRLYHGFYRVVWLSVGSSIVMSLLVLPVAYLIRLSVDKAIPAGNINLLVISGVGLFLLRVGSAGITLWTRHTTLKLTKMATHRLRDNLLQRVFAFSQSYYSQVDRKKLHANIVFDTERLDNLSQNFVMFLLPSLIISVVLAGVLIALNWYLVLIMVSLVPFMVIVNRMMTKKVKERTHRFQGAFVQFSKEIQFMLQVLELTWIQSAEKIEMQKQRKALEELHRAGRSMNWLNTAYREVNSTIVACMAVIILIVGGVAIISGSMTLGDLLSFYVVLTIVRTHVESSFSSIPDVIAGNESLLTLLKILNVGDRQPYSGTKEVRFEGGIVLEGVHFTYNDQPLLQSINMEVRPHSTVALIGPNGSGKSTIVNLILGFYRPQHGRLYAGDRPYEEIDMESLRRQIGVVPQDPILFPGTILENITYGYSETKKDQVVAAAELATAQEFIADLPQGYETFIGEHGVLLSGGQRQRIAIARALLRRPRFLVLDEPTNHLDASSIHNLMKNLRKAGNAPSILLISHNKTLLEVADDVYTLHQGGGIERVGEDAIAMNRRESAGGRRHR